MDVTELYNLSAQQDAHGLDLLVYCLLVSVSCLCGNWSKCWILMYQVTSLLHKTEFVTVLSEMKTCLVHQTHCLN